MTRHMSPFAAGAVLVLALLINPSTVHAVGSAADAMCDPIKVYELPCGMPEMKGVPPTPTGRIGGQQCPCQDVTNGFTTPGTCIAPLKCKASATAEGKSTGLGQVGDILKGMGPLMDQLKGMMQGGGGGGSGGGQGQGQGAGGLGTSPYGTQTGSGCTGAMYTVTYPTSDPCAIYQPLASDSLNGGSTLLDSFTGSLGGAVPSTQTPTTQNSSSLLQNLTQGAATQLENGLQSASLLLNGGTPSGQGSSLGTPTSGASATDVGTVGSGSSGGSTETVNTNDFGSGTSGGTDGGNTDPTAPSVGAMAPDVSLEGGARGDIMTGDGGATVIAGTRDAAANTEVAGFFGATGGAGQSLVGKWCTSRPWATNFLSKIVSPGFFDGLCTWRGYAVGTPPPAAAASGASTAAGGGAKKPVVVLQQRYATTTVQATTTIEVPAGRVQIWAVPAKVALGSRTSIFWATENVTACTETSPDGSFNHSSLSGGGTTVPLTGPTTFSISCLDGAGNPVTGFVTVTLKD